MKVYILQHIEAFMLWLPEWIWLPIQIAVPVLALLFVTR
jgi:hypothetical protein